MKLGVSYNVFDGEELLEGSIKQIREHVDHISVVYQTESYFGNKANEGLEDLIHDLKTRHLIDDIHKYDNNFSKNPQDNEKRKRNIGLNIAKCKLCSHFMNMDCDEFYVTKEFAEAKEFVKKEKTQASACYFKNYIKEPIYQLTQEPKTYVPFIYKINWFSKFRGRSYFPVLVDPTRKMNSEGKFKLFAKEEIMMHHMWAVRSKDEDILKKFKNSSGRMYESGVKQKDELVEKVLEFKRGKIDNFDVTEVPNQFNIYV
jgi:hypothetical protein